MKFKVVVILVGVVVLHLLVLTGVFMTGGCKGPEVFSQRNYIPAPAEYKPSTRNLDDEPGKLLVIDSVPELETPLAPKTNIQTPPPAPRTTELPPFQPVQSETLKYTVKKYDSLWKISRMYGVSIRELAAFNDLQPDKVLRIGTVLNIPPGGALLSPEKLKQLESSKSKRPKKKTTPRPATAPPATITVAENGLYTVKSGDSLWKIARAHKITVAALAAENNLSPDTVLQIGQRLAIPGGKTTRTTASPETKRPSTSPATPVIDDMDDIIGKVPDPTLSTTPGKKVTDPDAPKPEKKPTAATATFLLDKTDTIEVPQAISLEDFAKQFGIKPEDIRKLNPDLSADGQLEAGKILIIPSAK